MVAFAVQGRDVWLCKLVSPLVRQDRGALSTRLTSPSFVRVRSLEGKLAERLEEAQRR